MLKLRDKYTAATARITDHERFVHAVGMNDMPSVGRLVAVAIRQNRSIAEINRRIEMSIRGLYSVKSFTVWHTLPATLLGFDINILPLAR